MSELTYEDYELAKKRQDELSKNTSDANTALEKFVKDNGGKTSIGLTPDSIKSTNEYKKLLFEVNVSFERERNFNKQFVKLFKGFKKKRFMK